MPIGGFNVFLNGATAWEVDAATLHARFGDTATCAIAEAEGRWSVTVQSAWLLGSRTASLRLLFQQGATGSWLISARLASRRWVAVSQPRPFGPVGREWTLPCSLAGGSVQRIAEELGLRATQDGLPRGLELDHTLSPVLRPAGGGRVWVAGFPQFDRLALLSGQGHGTGSVAIAHLSDPVLGVTRRALGERDGLSATAEFSPLAGTAEILLDGAQRRSVYTGPLRLRIRRGARDEFVAAGANVSEISLTEARNQRPKLQLRLHPPTHAGAFETRHGHFDVLQPWVELSGDGQRVESFTARGSLVHASIRLPVRAAQPGIFADVGRLDFEEGGPTCAFLWGAPPPGTPLEATVRLGHTGPGPAVRILLNKARLTAIRQRDLLRLRFGFRHVVLEAGARPPRLVMARSLEAGCTAGDQPCLVVRFPPQHVLERAFARQLASFPEPPEPRAGSVKPEDRELFSRTSGEKSPEFKRFAEAYAEAWPAADPERFERFWIGSAGLTSVRGRQHARVIAERLRREPPAGSTFTRPQALVANLRLPLGPIVLGDILRRAGDLVQPDTARAALGEILREAANRDPEHEVVQRAYSEWRARQPTPATWPERYWLRGEAEAWQLRWSDELPTASPARTAFDAMWAAIGVPPNLPADYFALAHAATVHVGEALRDYYDEPFPDGPVEARAAGVTRLVFALPCAEAGLDYALDRLLDWEKLELLVTQRATRFEPTGEAELVNKLEDQGIRSNVSLRDRLHDIEGAACRGPTPHETAIEVPARLILSPDRKASFVQTPPTGAGPQPLWQAELREEAGRRATLRAVASPDFEPHALVTTGASPPRGPTPSWTGSDPFRASMDRFDRHELVALSSVHGLPVIPRLMQTPGAPNGQLQPQPEADSSQVVPPKAHEIPSGELHREDRARQGLYVPRSLPARFLALSALGASLDLDATFVPPAALRYPDGKNLFDAYSVERWRSVIRFGREITTEVIYKGFLYPLGHRATLVKVTERRFIPPSATRHGPTAYLIQRLFIQVGKPSKTHAIGQPFAGRGWPPRTTTILTRQTPDLMPQVLDRPPPAAQPDVVEFSSGRLHRAGAVGQCFWPKTDPSPSALVRFRVRLDEDAETIWMPLIFVDNQAAHDPATMMALRRYYNRTDWLNDTPPVFPAVGAPMPPLDKARRLIAHAGARRGYAPEREPGDTRIETLYWRIRADSRLEEPELFPAETTTPAPMPPEENSHYFIDGAMEGDDQPPFYPRLEEALIRLDTAGNLSGEAQPALRVTYFRNYLEGTGHAPNADDARKAPTADTFLRRVGGGSQFSMGSNGDRGGAIARPALEPKGVARIGPVNAGALSPATKPKFFGDDAKLLGLIPLNTLLEGLGNEAGPILSDVLQFGSDVIDVIKEAAARIREPLNRLNNEFDRVPQLNTVYPVVAAGLANLQTALDKIITPASNSDDDRIKAVMEFVTAARALARELERIAAAPLGDISAFGQREFARLRDDIEAQLRTLATQAWAGLAARTQAVLDQTRETLMPLTVAVLRAQLTAAELAALPPDALPRMFDAAWLATTNPPPAATTNPPPTLVELRARFAAALAPPPPAATDPLAVAAISGAIVRARAIITDLPLPPTVANLYALGVGLRGTDWPRLVSTIQAEAFAFLERWARGQAGALCGEAVAASQRLMLPLLPANAPADFAEDCGAEAACNAATSSLCGQLWDLLCRIQALPGGTAIANDLRVPSNVLALAVKRLAESLADIRRFATTAPGDACALLPLAALEIWQLALKDFVAALGDWLTAWSAASPRITDSAAQRVALLLVTQLLGLLPVAPSLPATAAQPRTALERLHAALREMRRLWLGPPMPTVPPRPEEVTAATAAITGAVAELRAALRDTLDQAALAAQAALLPPANDVASEVLAALARAYGKILDLRRAAVGAVDRAEGDLAGIGVGQGQGPGQPRLSDALYINRQGTTDALDREAARLTATSPPPLERLVALLRLWQTERPAPLRLVAGVGDQLTRAITARFIQALDLASLRTQLENAIKDLIPTKRKLTYDFALDVPEYPAGIVKFKPGGAKKLTLTASGEIDLRDPLKPPKLSARGRLDEFDIEIKDYLTFNFGAFTFTTEGGLDAPLKRVTPGEKLVFLVALAGYMALRGGGSSPGADKPTGPYVRRMTGGPGIRAGYGMSFGSFSIGTIGFANVVLDAHCDLPFDDGEGRVRITLSSAESPFVISCAPYGGGGHVGLVAAADGLRSADLSLQWGGAAIVSYGPLEGVGRIMTGISLRMSGGGAEIAGVFSASFVGHIACFGIAASFYLELSRKPDGRVTGLARLRYEFSLGFAKATFQVQVTRNEGGSLGSGSERQASLDTGGFTRFAALAGPGIAQAAPPPPATATTDATSPLQDWSQYRRLYTPGLRALGRRRP